MSTIQFSSLANRLRRTEIRELLKLTRTPGTISFGGGLPDPSIFPYEPVKKASIRAVEEFGRQSLQYSPTEGEPFFCEQVAAFMIRQGEKVRPNEIFSVASSQQGLDLLAKIFIDPGSAVIVERPSYVGAIQSFRQFGADLHGVAMDNDGIIPDRLKDKIDDLIHRGNRPRFIYLIPDFQNPSGINLSLKRRRQVLAIAAAYDLIVVEDSPYRELRFEGDLIPSLRSLDSDGRVIQMKTLSKFFSPGFRIGWITAPPDVLEKLIMAKQGTDLCTSAFTSIMTACLFQDGSIERQIEISKQLYAKKAKAMLDALDRYMPDADGLSWSHPEGGMFLWLRLPECIDTTEMLYDAVARKVAYVIGSCFYSDGSGRNEIRLNYSYPTVEEIDRGIRSLAEVVESRIHEEVTSAHRS